MKDKLLIVEDDKDQMEILTSYFSECGFDVYTAADGRKAVEAAERVHPDIVLLDISLPVLDGFEVLEELKNRKIQTRVVMTSGHYMDRDTAIRCIRSGACDFVGKPFCYTDVADRLQKYILVEKTLNLRIADTSPIVDKFMMDVKELETKIQELNRENRILKIKRSALDLLSKAIYLTLSVAAVLVLVNAKVVERGLGTALVLLMLLLLLMIPIERIQRLSAELAKFKTRLWLK